MGGRLLVTYHEAADPRPLAAIPSPPCIQEFRQPRRHLFQLRGAEGVLALCEPADGVFDDPFQVTHGIFTIPSAGVPPRQDDLAHALCVKLTQQVADDGLGVLVASAYRRKVTGYHRSSCDLSAPLLEV